MESKTNEQQQARALYFQSELSQQQIADRIGVNRKTLYTWIKEGHWLRAKRTAAAAPIFLSEQYYIQLSMINKAIAEREDRPYPTREEAEIIRKLSITLRHLPANNRAGDAIDVFELFIDKLTKTDLDLAKAVMPHMDEHVKYLYERSQGTTRVKDTYTEDADDREYNEWLRGQQNQTQTAASPATNIALEPQHAKAPALSRAEVKSEKPNTIPLPADVPFTPKGNQPIAQKNNTQIVSPAPQQPIPVPDFPHATEAEKKSINRFYNIMNGVMNGVSDSTSDSLKRLLAEANE